MKRNILSVFIILNFIFISCGCNKLTIPIELVSNQVISGEFVGYLNLDISKSDDGDIVPPLVYVFIDRSLMKFYNDVTEESIIKELQFPGEIISYRNHTLLPKNSTLYHAFSIICKTNTGILLIGYALENKNPESLKEIFQFPIPNMDKIISVRSFDIILSSENNKKINGYSIEGNVTRELTFKDPTIFDQKGVSEKYIYGCNGKDIIILKQDISNRNPKTFEVENTFHTFKQASISETFFHGKPNLTQYYHYHKDISIQIGDSIYYFKHDEIEPYLLRDELFDIHSSPRVNILSKGNSLIFLGGNPKDDKILRLKSKFEFLCIMPDSWLTPLYIFESYNEASEQSKILFIIKEVGRRYNLSFTKHFPGKILYITEQPETGNILCATNQGIYSIRSYYRKFGALKGRTIQN